jgi:hypothetical protein
MLTRHHLDAFHLNPFLISVARDEAPQVAQELIDLQQQQQQHTSKHAETLNKSVSSL